MSNKVKPKDGAAPKLNVLGGVGNALGQNVGAQTDKDDESKVKGHPLKKSHFPSPVVCGVCKKNIWGVGKQGYKCSKCDLTVHKKCIEDLTNECSSADSTPPIARAQSKLSGDFTGLAAKSQPALVIDDSKLVPTFGSKLEALMGFETLYNPSATMPSVVEKSLHFLMQNGLSVEGIFRIPGGSGKMNAIIDKFNKGQGLQIDFRKEQCSEADVSSVLKKYFRDLPEPLFTNALQAQFQDLQGIEQYADRNPRFLELFKQLPKVNQKVAKEFLFFLYQVATNSHMNMMNTDNLATIFGTMAGVFFSFDHGHDLVMYMIDEYPTLFEEEDMTRAREPLFRRRLVGHLRSVITLIPYQGMMFSFDSNGMVRWWKEQEMKPVSHLNGGAKLFSNPFLVGDWLWAVTPQEVITWNAKLLLEKGSVPDAKRSMPIRGELTGTLVGDNIWLAGEKLLVVDQEGQTVRDLTDYTNDMMMCMDKAGKYVWSWRSKVIYVYNPDTFEKVAEIKDVCNSKAIFFAAVGSNIWVACDDASILVISENDFSLVSKLTQHKGCVYHIASVGPVVLSCAWDKTIRIWDPVSFSPLGTLDNIHTDAISYLMPRKRSDGNSFELWTASWDRSINVSYIPSAYLSQFKSSGSGPSSDQPVMVLPPVPLRAPSNPSFVGGQISPGRVNPPPPQFLPPPPQNLPPPLIGDRPVSPTPLAQVLPPLQSSNTVPNLLPRPPARPKGPMPKGDHVLKSKSAASVFESPQQRDQLLAKVGAPGPKKGLAPTPVPRSQTSAGLKAPSPRSSGQMGQLNATLGNLCSEITDLQQQREALDQQIQEHISSLKQEIESMSKGGNSDTWVALKAKLEDLHQQESDLTTKYAEVSKSLTETRQLVRLAELQQLLEQIEAKDNLSETPRH